MKSREDEGIENRWKRRAELSAESPGRKTTPPEDCTIAHPLVFYPLVVAFRPCARFLPPFSPLLLKSTSRLAFLLCMHQPILPSNSVYTNPFRRFPLFRLGHRTQFYTSSMRTLARFSVKRAIPCSTKLLHFFRQTAKASNE